MKIPVLAAVLLNPVFSAILLTVTSSTAAGLSGCRHTAKGFTY